MRKILYFLIAAGFIYMLHSCTYNEYVEPEAPPVDTTKVYSFATDVQPIFDSKCVSCHGGAKGLYLEADVSYNNIVPALVNLETPEESMIYTKAKTGHYANYEAEEAQNILQWIKQGAENN